MAETKTKNAKATTETKVAASAAKTTQAQSEKDQITLSKDELQAMIAKAVAEATSTKEQTPILNVVAEEKVTLLFIGAIAKGTEVALGEIGKITKDGGMLQVNKNFFFQHINSVVESLLDERKLMIIDGVTEDDKQRYGLDYDDSEVLTQKDYRKLLDYDEKTIVAIYTNLCKTHKEIVTKVFATALSEGDSRLNIATCKALNAISKQHNPQGDFTFIVKQLAEQLGQDA